MPFLIRALAVLGKALPRLSGQVLTQITSRLGLAAGAGVREVIAKIRQNPTLFWVVLSCLGDDVVNEVMSLWSDGDDKDSPTGPPPASLFYGRGGVRLPALSFERTEVPTNLAVELSAQADDMLVISRAVTVVGSLSRLESLRRALTLSDQHFDLFRTMKALPR